MRFKLSYFVAVLSFVTFVCTQTNRKVVCYHGSWSVYRPSKGQFTIENINPHLCTHLIYSFVGLNANGTIRILDPGLDIDKRGFARFNALRQQNPNLKTLVSIGGWNGESSIFSKVSSTQSSRATFINNVVNFVKQHGFNGFDLDWEYPAQRGGSPQDKVNFGLLVKEFRAAFNKYGYLLTAAVGATPNHIGISYDVPTLSQNLDFINIMAYDLHGHFDGVTGENSPLYAHSQDVTAEMKQRNVDTCIRAWIANGAAPQKLVLGIPVYGRTFTLNNPSNTAIAAPAPNPGKPGPYTAEAGTLSYNEICEFQLGGQWRVVWNDQQKVPYAYLNDQWHGYDNTQSVALKVDYAKRMNLGGVMIWAIENDDFRGVCGSIYPTLSTINSRIRQT